jgi:hypothetical protein
METEKNPRNKLVGKTIFKKKVKIPEAGIKQGH